MLGIVLGDLGSGKTLFLTYLAYKSEFHNIYTNYHLNIPQKNIIMLTPALFRHSFEKLNGLMLIDEIYTLIDSRNSMNENNKLLSYILFQSRKKDIQIWITAQMFSTIDKRFREFADFLVSCKKLEKSGYFYYKIYSIAGNTKKIILTPKITQILYSFYDTNEVINSMNISLDINFLNKEIIPKIISIMKQKNLTKITRDTINLIGIMLNLTKTEKDYCYYLLKTKEEQNKNTKNNKNKKSDK
ncbi:MAG: AAA family ATPase [Promethearchaeota archaeon]